MTIRCQACKSVFKIPDEKIEKMKGTVLACPKCGGKVPVHGSGAHAAGGESNPEKPLTYDASKKPFDFLDAGSRTAIVCATDPPVKAAMLRALEEMGYHVTRVQNSREALRNMWYHTYNLVLLDELFDTDHPDRNRVLAYLQGLGMAMRREMVAVLFSRSLNTMDEMGAFQKSVNQIINVKHLPETSRILRMTLKAHETFYRIYRDVAQKETTL